MRERSTKITNPTASYLEHELEPTRGFITDLQNYSNEFGRFELRQTRHPDVETHILDGPDGFPFILEISGPADGVPILVYPGMPRNRIRDEGDPTLDIEDALIVTYDRRGYGPFGFPAIGRQARDEVPFAKKIMQYAGFKSVGAVGRSVGAAFACEVAAALAKLGKAHSLSLIAPMGPFGLMDEKIFFKNMNSHNRKILKAGFYPPFTKEYRRARERCQCTHSKLAQALIDAIHVTDGGYGDIPPPPANPDGLEAQIDALNETSRRCQCIIPNVYDYTEVQGLLDALYETTHARYADIQTYQTNPEDKGIGLERSNLEAQIDALGRMSLGRVADIVAIKGWGFCLYDIKDRRVPTYLWAPKSGDEFTPRAHMEVIANLLGSIAVTEFEPDATHLDGVRATTKGVGWCISHGKGIGRKS